MDVYCICRKPHGNTFMIECDQCKDWFHGSCVGVQEHQASFIERYHCPLCAQSFGPLTLKERPIDDEQSYETQSSKVKKGIVKIIRSLKSRQFPSAEEIVIRLAGKELNKEYLNAHGFSQPILIEKKDGLDLRVPPPSFSVEDIEKHIGPLFEFDVINVEHQEDNRMFMRQWTEYFNSPGKREKILNVISLEFSKTKLSTLVEPPRIVKELSWVSTLWPEERIDDLVPERPEVQKYCLMGVKDSYTDFHIDFGGTSVWYHVLKGEKVFFLVEPNPENLQLFESWESSSKQDQTFFGDLVKWCYRLVLKQGQTLFIPTAWIHAVYTPIDSLVFGGNFLHSYNVPLQLEAYQIERRLDTQSKYQFPNYETVNWLAAKCIFDSLQGYAEAMTTPPVYLLSGAEALTTHLKMWTQRKDYSKRGNDPAQLEGISYGKLIKDLNGVIKKLNTNSKKPKAKQRGKKRNVKGKVLRQEEPVTEKEAPKHVKLRVNLKKETKKEQKVDEEDKNNVYIFRDEEEDVTPQRSTLKVRIPKKSEDPKVSPIKIGLLKKEEKNRKRKHKKSRKKNKEEGGDTFETEAPVSVEKAPLKLKLGHIETKEEEEDSDRDNLVVDESPRSKQAKISLGTSLSLKLSFNTKCVPEQESEPVTWSTTSPDPERDSIAEILKGAASQYDSNPFLQDTSTEMQAAESMLSMSAGSSSLHAATASFVMADPVRPSTSSASNEEEQLMSDCHQEGEFLYYSYDLSDEEHLEGRSTRVQERDDNWNPKAKINVPHKTDDRTPRLGTKKEAIASGLAATARKLEENPRPMKLASKKLTGGKVRESRVPAFNSSLSGSTSSPLLGPSTGAGFPYINRKVVDRTPTPKKPKKTTNRKGYQTAKQRLGKILKIFK